MATVYPAALSHFAVFCPALGATEDSTHEQLLFYAAATLPAFYPYTANDYYSRSAHLRRRSSGSGTVKSHSPGRMQTGTTEPSGNRERVVSLDTKLREIGLASALVMFADTFSPSNQFYVVHSEKRRSVIFTPEQGVIIHLSIVLPRKVMPFGKEKDAYSIEFLDNELDDRAIQPWLEAEYHAFRLLFGPIGRALRGNRQRVIRQLDSFFGRTVWSWDKRWDRKHGDELDLLHSLAPLPQLPIGPISLGGFDELWQDMKSIDDDVVSDVVVLWHGDEVVWSSIESHKVLRAMVAWSRAVFAPAFVHAAETKHKSHAAPARNRTLGVVKPNTARQSSWGSSWLFGWGKQQQQPPQQQQPSSLRQESTGTESRDSTGSESGAETGNGGFSQVLSRAVDILVEPRPPTPPEVDPVFLTGEPVPEQFHVPNDGLIDSDAESIHSIRSITSVRTTATVALSRQSVSATLGRARANTHMNFGVPLRGRSHSRAASILSNSSVVTTDTMHLRDDTRVSSRSSWWNWGSGESPSLPAIHSSEMLDSEPSGTDPTSTFLFTGASAFPGLPQPGNVPQDNDRPEHILADDLDADGVSNGETISRLEEAMEEGIPEVYEHGIDVDVSRGVVLAPRAIAGMQYDTRLVKLMFQTTEDMADSPMPAEMPLCVGDSVARHFVYCFGDLLFIVFGQPAESTEEEEESAGRSGRRRGGRRNASKRRETFDSVKFSSRDCQQIETTILRYAENLQATTKRDYTDISAKRRAAINQAKTRRIPPYIHMDKTEHLARTNWKHDGALPMNQNFAGYVSDEVRSSGNGLASNVRRAISVVQGEQRGGAMVCARMQDKGWVAGMDRCQFECVCVVDQPKATLADAQTFLSK
ncbi:hypothetical protein FBU59_000856, partial [Linderina macrospora]